MEEHLLSSPPPFFTSSSVSSSSVDSPSSSFDSFSCVSPSYHSASLSPSSALHVSLLSHTQSVELNQLNSSENQSEEVSASILSSNSSSSPVHSPQLPLSESVSSSTALLSGGRSLCIFLFGLLLLIAPFLTAIAMTFSLFILTFNFSCDLPLIRPPENDKGNKGNAGEQENTQTPEINTPLFCCFHPIIHYYYLYSILLSLCLLLLTMFGTFKRQANSPSSAVTRENFQPNENNENQANSSNLSPRLPLFTRVLHLFSTFSTNYFPLFLRVGRLFFRSFSVCHLLFSLSMIGWSFYYLNLIVHTHPPHITKAIYLYPPDYLSRLFTPQDFCSISNTQISFFVFADFLILFVASALLIRLFGITIPLVHRIISFFDRIEIVNNLSFDIEIDDVQYDLEGNPTSSAPGPMGVEKRKIEEIPTLIVACKAVKIQEADGQDIQLSKQDFKPNASSLTLQIESVEDCNLCEANRSKLIFMQFAITASDDATIAILSPANTSDSSGEKGESASSQSPVASHLLSPPSSDREVCSVCLEPFRYHGEVKQMPQCHHVFHSLCLDRWLFRVNACPLCRSKV
jgi:hypothetical protein